MQNDINVMIKFLNDLVSSQNDFDKLNKIVKINEFKQFLDIYNGERYMSEVIKDPDVCKFVEIRNPQDNINIYGQRISNENSFICNCDAIIDALAKSILEDKIKDEFKNQLNPNIRNYAEWVEYYKNILKQQRS